MKPRKFIRRVSKKKAKVIRYRKKLRAELIQERGDICQLKCSPDCRGRAEGLHEPLKQSASAFKVGDTREVLLSCHPCNNFIEDNPLKAKALGLSISKYGETV